MSQSPSSEDPRMVVWFDIDNTLYSASTQVSQAMGRRIHEYFRFIGLDDDEASVLHANYYTQYGLALRGLIAHHQIDPLDFDRKCDGTLPLNDLIRPDPKLRKLFEDIDRSKVRVWALTNAYKHHANRVLEILNLSDQIDGLVFCDYEQPNFSCKPQPNFYLNAMKQAGISDASKCLFVDDSKQNVIGAERLGWGRCVHFHEGGRSKTLDQSLDTSADVDRIIVINDLEELRVVWPDIFRQ